MRSIWAGAISFGLVVIPVKLYAATEQRDIAFRQVHRKDGARIQFRRFCTLDGEEVPYADIAKGYELPTGDMVVLTDEDLADLPLVTAHRIEVLHFAPSAQVEPIYANKSYYLEPDSAGARAYVLFRDALENSEKVAVAKVALRQREALEAVVQAKIEGNEIVRPAGVIAPPQSQPADLTEILRASVAALKSERGQADDTAKSASSAEPDGRAKSGTRGKASPAAKGSPAAKDAEDAKEGTAAKSATRRKASA